MPVCKPVEERLPLLPVKREDDCLLPGKREDDRLLPVKREDDRLLPVKREDDRQSSSRFTGNNGSLSSTGLHTGIILTFSPADSLSVSFRLSTSNF
jgi:hypothetical protein